MFSDILKDLRAKSGLSQGQLAKAVGVSPGNVSDWEVGKTKPGYAALSSLARFFDVSADYLLELDDKPVKMGDDLSRYKKEQGLICDGSPLTDLESDLVAMFRLLPSYQQEELFDLVYFKYKRYSEEKKGSIYSTYFGGKESSDEQSGPARGSKTQDGTA